MEKSQDGRKFFNAGSVLSNGNINTIIRQYDLFDDNPFNGTNFYRIKIIDKTGEFTFSNVLKVIINNNLVNRMVIYPNPINNNISVQLNLPKGNYNIIVTNKLGEQLESKMINYLGGSSTENLRLSNVISAGIYQLKLTGGGVSIVRQFIKK